MSRGFIANVFIHETLHHLDIMTGRTAGHCQIYADAYRMSGYRINPDPSMGCPAF